MGLTSTFESHCLGMPFTKLKKKTSLCCVLKCSDIISRSLTFLKFYPSYKRKSSVEKKILRWGGGYPLVEVDTGINTIKRLLR